jgi:hypothetical protein
MTLAADLVANNDRDARDELLKGLARAHVLDGLEARIAAAIVSPGWNRWVAGRAEVERRLALDPADYVGAERALRSIADGKARSHAARSIAEALARQGSYADALQLVHQEIVESNSELVPDVARGVAFHVRTALSTGRPDVDELTISARNTLFRLLQLSAQHLDGTYRVIASMISSRVFMLDLVLLNQVAALCGWPTTDERVAT